MMALHSAALALTALASLAATPDLPDGPGKAVVQSSCTQCHGEEVITARLRSRDEWTEVVSRMVGAGAQLSDEDYGLIVNYLSAHFGPPAKAPPDPTPGPIR